MNPRLGKIWLTMITMLAVFSLAFLVVGQTSAHLQNTLFSQLPADQQECVEKALGEDVYSSLTDWSQLTEAMKLKMGQAQCFGPTVSQPAPTTTTDQSTPRPTGTQATNPFTNMPEQEKSCLKDALGPLRFGELEAGSAFSETDTSAIENSGCFGKKTALGSEQIVPVKANPFDDMHPSMVECLKGALGESRLTELKNGTGFTDDDKAKVEGANCFKGEGKYIGGEKPAGANPEVEECVKGIIGEDRMNELRSAGTPPTPGEMEKMAECFKKDKKYLPNPVYAREGLPTDVDKCMRLALGDRYEDIKRGLVTITEEDRRAGYKCIGKADDPIAPPPEMVMSDDLKKCLIEAVGEERFNQIKSGQEPTDEEKSQGMGCFEDHEKKKKPKTIQSDQLLPPPPEEVPFIKEDSQAVDVKEVNTTQDTVVVSGEVSGAKEGTVVDVYFYSDPVQATATVGRDGQTWTLNYDGQLPEGEHKIYAVVKKGSENVRSAVEKYVVGAAQAQTLTKNISNQTTAKATPITQPTRRVLDDVVYLVGGLLIIVLLGLLIYVIMKNKQQSAKPPEGS